MSHNYTPPHHYFERPMEIELIRSMCQKRPAPVKAEPIGTAEDGFITKKASEWLAESDKLPDAKMLFDRFWYENELCILFADTNTGKSILAVQLADSISRESCVGNFELTVSTQTVLYIDFELSAKQFSTRYSDGVYGMYRFGDNFLRSSVNPDAKGAHRFKNRGEYIINALENAILNAKAKVLIIDNITCLGSGTHGALPALNLISQLQDIKNKYKISILVLAHTPKRNGSKPISRDDLQGSKMLINFCDSAFAIGDSATQPGQRYLKQIKQRNTAETYGPDNVCLCRIVKHYNFLQFEFTDQGIETDHLRPRLINLTAEVEQKIIELHAEGQSIRQIAAQTGYSASHVYRVLKGAGK
ncbi:AAA family ATPase [Mucilaginibacter ginkgonis]|uniref:AAA family ATPase n=1 Tax=Mucilaginibacter ginkgonis TaxID=2682091 RepID=A0A6I4HZL8_9SPHI|nr:AAA family ATPase [Mucilaginibacter ginkgonis]QQL49549.1 AAA family ATPase [Mucilaginibacter ginkgonis]